MEQDEKDLLQKTYDLAKENNHILKGIRSSNRWASFFRFLYWLILVGISVGAFYFAQPYVNNLLNAYSKLQGFLPAAKSVTASTSLPK